MEYETLTVDRSSSGVVLVRLNRPPVNAVNKRMQLEIRECFDSLSLERSVRAVVLAASGTKVFSAGIDLKEISSPEASEDLRTALDFGIDWRDAQHAVRHCAVPVIAAVEGLVIGAGFGLVGVCDLIVAAEHATFGLTEINVGLLGGAAKALRMLGPFKARAMFFSGKMLPASELYRFGAIEEVVPSGQAEARARELAEEFATKSPIVLRLAKESLLRIEGDEVEERYRTEQDYVTRVRAFDDSREAMQAFAEKRAPVWTWQ
jgi:enoyl-CoA hydratase